MASNTFTQHFVDGTSVLMRRVVKQGAPHKDKSALRRHPVTVRLTDAEYVEYLDAKQAHFLRPSDFAATALSIGIRELFASNKS